MADTTITQFLWLSADGSRCFLIPAETVFHSGTFGLVSYNQEPMGVAEYSILNFEVSREKAQQHLMEEYHSAIQQAQKAQQVLSAFMENKLPGDPDLKNEPSEEDKKDQQLVMAMLGGETEDISKEQKEELEKNVKTYLSSPEASDSFSKISTRLDKFSQFLKRSPSSHGNNLQEIITSLASEMNEEEDISKKEKNKAELKKKVEESIANALKNK